MTLPPSTNRWPLPWTIMAVVLLLALSTSAIISTSLRSGHSLSSRYPPLVDATMEIKLETTQAHLWLEEILAGDPEESLPQVYQHLDQAIWYAEAMLQGGQNSEGSFAPLQTPELRNEISQALDSLQRFKQKTRQRVETAAISRPGSRSDQEYDRLYHTVIHSADQVESALQYLLQHEQRRFTHTQQLLIGLTLLVTALALITFYRYERHKRRTLAQLQQLNQQLEQRSNTDGLTGCHNRRYLDHCLELEWERAQRDQQPLTLILFDLDHFKAYNDLYGHPAGDDCLKQVVSTIQQQLKRPADRLFRYGGEEFALLLPNTRQAQQLAEHCRRQIHELQLPHRGHASEQVVTLSAGIATLLPTASDTPLELINLADQALYRAKQQGRNRVCLA